MPVGHPGYICICKLNTVSVYPLANLVCIPAFKLFHPPVWSNEIGSLGIVATGVQAGTCCVDLSEYLNGKRIHLQGPCLFLDSI